MRFLLTGFEPFLSNQANPSMDVLPLVEKETTSEVKTLVLPVVFDEVFDKVKQAIDSFKPDVIIHLGLAENRDKIALERVAINIKDARAEDNKGKTPVDEVIVEDGENAYFSTLPLRQFEEALKARHIPVYISNSAGTYVCNNVMYHTLHYLKTTDLSHVQAGFIHLPLMREQSRDNPSAMPLLTIKEAILTILASYS